MIEDWRKMGGLKKNLDASHQLESPSMEFE